MDKSYESIYLTEEEHNWWFVARRDMLIQWMRKYKVPYDAAILDIGCAGGSLLVELKKLGYTNLTALDYSAEAIAVCKARGIDNAFVMDGHHPDFPAQTFDLIIASDSLEHLKDDETALANWIKIMKPGGKVMIYVPAYMFLWTYHDDINYHFRRYTKTELDRKVKAAGFKTLVSGYWNFSLFFPTTLVRLITGKKKPKDNKDEGDIVRLPPVLSRLLKGWLFLENRIGKTLHFPVGVSAYTIAEKP